MGGDAAVVGVRTAARRQDSLCSQLRVNMAGSVRSWLVSWLVRAGTARTARRAALRKDNGRAGRLKRVERHCSRERQSGPVVSW